MRTLLCVAALILSVTSLDSSAAECPNWELGTAIGLGKSCNLLKASESELRATIPVLAENHNWDCSPSDLSNMIGAISDGMNYDRYDNHFELCGNLDQHKIFFIGIDALADALRKQQ